MTGNRRLQGGSTLAELLVCAVVVGAMAACGMSVHVRAGRLERNLRREAYARTALALHLERLERMLSLADGMAGSGGTDSAGEDLVRATYPQEVGGVSFETNSVMRVRETALRKTAGTLRAVVTNRNDGLELVGTERRFDADFPLALADSGHAAISGFSVSNVAPGLVSVRLESAVELETSRGGKRVKTVAADRIVRLWNVK